MVIVFRTAAASQIREVTLVIDISSNCPAGSKHSLATVR